MLYKLYIKTGKAWRQIGLDHLSVSDAQEEALVNWPGLPFVIIPSGP